MIKIKSVGHFKAKIQNFVCSVYSVGSFFSGVFFFKLFFFFWGGGEMHPNTAEHGKTSGFATYRNLPFFGQFTPLRICVAGLHGDSSIHLKLSCNLHCLWGMEGGGRDFNVAIFSSPV